MSVDMSVFWERIGAIAHTINVTNTFRGSTTGTRATTILGDFTSAQSQLIDSLFTQRDSYRGVHAQWISYLQTLAQNTAIQMCVDDTGSINPKDLPTALRKLVAQMESDTETINRPTLGMTPTADSGNTGDGTCIVSTTDPVTGDPLDMIFDETVIARCLTDGYTGGGGTAGQESFSLIGQPIAPSQVDWQWPMGSGANTTTTVVNPSATGGLVTNGSFADWDDSGQMPDSWEAHVGSIGTTMSRLSPGYGGDDYAMRFTGNGTELTNIRQEITGLSPSTAYAFHMRAKSDGSVAAGVIQARLVDSNGTTITDNAGNDIAVTANASSLTSSYTVISSTFNTPAVLPSTIMLEIRFSTAVTNTETIDLDDIALVASKKLYAGGPYVALVAGATNFARDDFFTIVVTNSLGVTSLVRTADRLFDMRAKGLRFPTSGTPDYADGLIA